MPAEVYVDNVVLATRKHDFPDGHPGWKIWCENHRWYSDHYGLECHDIDLGLLMDRLEQIVKTEGET
jgi:hypothetical protein